MSSKSQETLSFVLKLIIAVASAVLGAFGVSQAANSFLN